MATTHELENAVRHTEYRVIGPPGTGKTTYLVRQAIAAAKKFAERPADAFTDSAMPILFSSLTRAAAGELRQRGLDLAPEAIGTLHSHAWRALGRPALCVDAKSLAPWNTKYPQWTLSGDRQKAPDVEQSEGGGGDGWLHEYHVARSRLKPRELWNKRLIQFANAYEEWKAESGLVDFSDVIHDAYETCFRAPGDPRVIFVDEAQDHDRAELRLIRRWAESCDYVIICGDPDQNLYEWRGSDPAAFYDVDIPPENTRVLSQSYRVPRKVHALACEMIGRCRNRRPVAYEPRDEPGVVATGGPSFSTYECDDLVRDASRDAQAGTVMLLAACEYMLRPVCTELRDRGIPFWNPFAKDRGQFNPLHPSKGTPAAQRLLAYLRPSVDVYGNEARLWNWLELWQWVEICEATTMLKHGAKKTIERRAAREDSPPLTKQDLSDLFVSLPDALLKVDPTYLLSRTLKSRRETMAYAARIFRRAGARGLLTSPQIIVGTIHSIKGGEADTVYLCPDLSPQGFDQLESPYPDPVYRLFYVGMTRARNKLVLCEPKPRSGMFVEW